MAWEKVIFRDGATTGDTVKLILQTIRQYSSQKPVKQIVADLGSPTESGFFQRLFEFVCTNVNYVEDPPDDEQIYTPARTLREGRGDCKKMTVLIGAILKQAGVPFYVRIIAYKGEKWKHIYVIVPLSKGGYITLDPVNYCKYNREAKHANSITFNIKGDRMKLSQLGSLDTTVYGFQTNAIGNMDGDIDLFAGQMGAPEGFDEDVEDSEVEIYSLAGLGLFHGIGRRRSKAERKRRRQSKRRNRKAKKRNKKLARAARKKDRKDRRKFLKSLPRNERQAVKKNWRKQRKARRKFARKVKKLGKSTGLPGAISKYIGKHPEIFLAYFLKNNNPEVELSSKGVRKFNRVAAAVNKVKRRKGVEPAELLAFVDTVIEKKYGMPAEEFALVYAEQTRLDKLRATGLKGYDNGMGEIATVVIVGAIAAASAIATAVIGLKKKELNASDLPDSEDIVVVAEGGGTTDQKSKVGAWLKDNAGNLLSLAGNAYDKFKAQVGADPSGEDIDSYKGSGEDDDDEDDEDLILGLKPKTLMIVGSVVAAAVILPKLLPKRRSA